MPPTIRAATPPVDEAVLEVNLRAYVARVGSTRAFAFGVYAGVPMGNAVRGKGLLALHELLTTLIASAKHMSFKHITLKAALLNTAYACEGLHDRRRPMDRWPEQCTASSSKRSDRDHASFFDCLRYSHAHCSRRLRATWCSYPRWAGDVAERLFCLANHCRRVKHSALRMSQACRDLSEEEVDRLTALVESMDF